jgi:hypothetical protein
MSFLKKDEPKELVESFHLEWVIGKQKKVSENATMNMIFPKTIKINCGVKSLSLMLAGFAKDDENLAIALRKAVEILNESVILVNKEK